jgi:hypothetical protein
MHGPRNKKKNPVILFNDLKIIYRTAM